MTSSPGARRMGRPTRLLAAGLITATSFSGIAPLLPSATAGAAGATAPVYRITAEGMTPDSGARLAEQARIGNALRSDGSFTYTNESRYAVVPSRQVATGKDENGEPTVSEAVDFRALKEMTVISEDDALRRAEQLLAVPKHYDVEPIVGHTTVEQSDAKGRLVLTKDIDTTVSYRYHLAGVPVIGPGAKAKVSFDGRGRVLQLTQALREVEQAGEVAIISPRDAMAECARLYGPKVPQNEPTLSYYAPQLGATEANGKGTAELVLPQYICQPVTTAEDEVSKLTGRMVPAAPEFSPRAAVKASSNGRVVTASATIEGGQAPYSIAWSSSSTVLDKSDGTTVRYAITTRNKLAEKLTFTVTDANGQTAAGTVVLARPGRASSASAESIAGGQGGSFAKAGIEQTVDEWQCAQDSANGFKDVMQSKSQTVKFDWRGNLAWEKDFKKSSLSGLDNSYVDSVDIQWYTGHGSPGSFTFKTNNSDKNLVPSDASWGDNNLEWLQLESCQVLRDVNGSADYFGRWGPTMNGLHLLNGFDTNAYCVGGGTGRRFAEYLFPATFLWWTTRPALTVQQAWARMADDLEPAGVRWRSMSLIGAGGVHNLGDHYWGQGSVGPDIPYASRTGMIAISGVT